MPPGEREGSPQTCTGMPRSLLRPVSPAGRPILPWAGPRGQSCGNTGTDTVLRSATGDAAGPGGRTRPATRKVPPKGETFFCGAKENRTPDLLHAMQALYQLSYSPARSSRSAGRTRRTLACDQPESEIRSGPHPGEVRGGSPAGAAGATRGTSVVDGAVRQARQGVRQRRGRFAYGPGANARAARVGRGREGRVRGPEAQARFPRAERGGRARSPDTVREGRARGSESRTR